MDFTIGYAWVYESWFQKDAQLWFSIPWLITTYCNKRDISLSQLMTGSIRSFVATNGFGLPRPMCWWASWFWDNDPSSSEQAGISMWRCNLSLISWLVTRQILAICYNIISMSILVELPSRNQWLTLECCGTRESVDSLRIHFCSSDSISSNDYSFCFYAV